MFFLLVGLVIVSPLFTGVSKGQTKTTDSAEERLRIENQSLHSLVSTLAGERYALNERRGETWILSAHDWTKNTNHFRYTGDGVTLVSIAVFPDDLAGFRCYASAYNTFNLRAADLKAVSGDFEGAKKLYRLLRRFDPSGEIAKESDKRLKLLIRQDSGENVKHDLDELLREYKTLDTFPKLAELWDIKATRVPTLESVTLP